MAIHALEAPELASFALRASPYAHRTTAGHVMLPESELSRVMKLYEARGYPAEWQHRTQPYEHQRTAFEFGQFAKRWALFGEQGTGKTKILLDVAAFRMHHDADAPVDLVLIITKKAVHRQWVREQLAAHWPDHLPLPPTFIWDGKRLPAEVAAQQKLVAAFNVDALNSEKGRKALTSLLRAFGRSRTMVIYDESHLLKNPQSKRNKRAQKVIGAVDTRVIATGTPITRSSIDIFGQFLLLGWDIIGHKSIVTFRSQYCIMGGPNGNWVQGSKNLPQLNELIAPYTFRIRKDILRLPPVVHDTVPYDLTPAQRRHYDQLRTITLTQLDNGEIVSVQHALTQLVRLQQVMHGFLPHDGCIESIDPHHRAEQLLDILAQRTGPALIWARFRQDVRNITHVLGNEGYACAIYHGEMKQAEREAAIETWLRGERRVLVATIQAGSTGLNLQSGGCDTVIYYGHTFNATDRWQSEARVHRIGTQGTVTYFDLVAQGTLDEHIIRNLRKKKEMSKMVLDDIREMLQ